MNFNEDDRNMLLNTHNRIMLVRDGKILEGGKISKSSDENEKIGFYKYDIHDFFK